MKAPALILGFDDWFIDEWYSTLNLLQQYDMKATFYLSNFMLISNKQWDKLKGIRDKGHTIGYHGLNHIRAGSTVKEYGEKYFLDIEIYPGLEKMNKYGFLPQHYSYPQGNRNEDSDRILLEIFQTLRVGGTKYFTAESFMKARILPGLNMGKRPESRIGWHEQSINRLEYNNEIAVFYMHYPIVWRLEYIGKATKEKGIKVCGL